MFSKYSEPPPPPPKQNKKLEKVGVKLIETNPLILYN